MPEKHENAFTSTNEINVLDRKYSFIKRVFQKSTGSAPINF